MLADPNITALFTEKPVILPGRHFLPLPFYLKSSVSKVTTGNFRTKTIANLYTPPPREASRTVGVFFKVMAL
jgi:hypothetical protein